MIGLMIPVIDERRKRRWDFLNNVLDINNINPPMRLEVAQPILDFKDIEKKIEILT